MSLASTIVSQLVTSAGAQTKGTSKRKDLLWPAVDEGIPSIMVEKHGSKGMGNPGYVASSSQEAGRQKLAFCCLFKKRGIQLMKWYPLHTERSFSSQLNLSGHFLTHMQKCAPSTIPSPVKLTRNPNDGRVHSAFQIHEEKANYPHHGPPSQ